MQFGVFCIFIFCELLLFLTYIMFLNIILLGGQQQSNLKQNYRQVTKLKKSLITMA